MKYSPRRKHSPARKQSRPARGTILRLERLEDRTLLSGGEWLAHFDGLAGTTRQDQIAAAQQLLSNAGLASNVQVVDHVGVDGTLVLTTTDAASSSLLAGELHAVPGFQYVEPYDPNADPSTLLSQFPTPPALEDDGGDANQGDTGAVAPDTGTPTIGGSPDASVLKTLNGFGGIFASQGGYWRPPDTNGAVGPNTYIETVNNALAIYDKTTGTPISGGGVTSFATFFAPLTGQGRFSDPVAVYNEMTGQFAVGALDFHTDAFGNATDSRFDLAISKTSNPTLSASDWSFYRYNTNDFASGVDFSDYPKMGYNADGYVISFNMFPYYYDHTDVLAVRNDGTSAGIQQVPGGFSNFTLAPASEHGAAPGSPMWFVEAPGGASNSSASSVTVVRMDNPFSATPTYTFSSVGVNFSYGAPNERQPNGYMTGSANLGTRFYFSGLRTVNGVTHLVAAHTVGNGFGDQVDWYDFNVGGTAPTLIQEGAINPGTSIDTYFPDADIAPDGTIGLSYSQSSSTQYVSMYVTAHRPGDPAGTMQTPVLAVAGTANLYPNDRAGDYSRVSVDPVDGSFWAANEYATNYNTYPNWTTWIQHFSASGLSVTGSTPAPNSVVSVPPTSFVIDFSDAVDPSSVQASNFTVNGTPADAVTLNDTDTEATFTFNSSPVTVQGLQTMAVVAGSITKLGGGATIAGFSAHFRYDAVLLAPTSTDPAVGGDFSIPADTFTYDVNFNEPIDPATAKTSNLTLSQGTVTGVTVQPGNQSVEYTITGLTKEGPLNVAIAAGALTDQYGNPGAAFSATYQVDIGTEPYPTDLTAEKPLGSLVYDPTTSGFINVPGDTDNFTLNVDAGQTITAVVHAVDGGLQPTVTLLDPSGATLGSASAPTSGSDAVLQTVPAATAGTYTVTVGGIGGTTGNYTVQLILNSAVNAAEHGGPVNDTLTTAQDIESSFLNLESPPATDQRGAVLGTFKGTDQYYSFHLDAGQPVTLGAVLSAAPNTNLFDTAKAYPTGSNPNGVATADINGDGKLDLITTNPNNWTVSVLLGKGDGTFGPARTFFAGYYPSAVAVADVNGDGKADLIVADEYNNTFSSGGVSVLLGNGDGTFGSPTTYSTGGSNTEALAVGDLNGDGKVDVVAANYYSQSVSVLLNSGNGTFYGPSTYYAGSDPASVALGDLNGDGKLDVVVGDYYNNTFSSGGVSVLLNQGGGTLGPQASYATGGYGTQAVALADFNGDGKLDVVAANIGNQTVSVLSGTGTGALGSPVSYTTGFSPYSVAVGDLNADGHPDIVTSNYAQTASVLLNNGSGGFGSRTDYNAGSYHTGHSDIALGDFNGDGLLDLATADYYNGTDVLLNQTSYVNLQLLDADGNVLATGTPGSANFDTLISNFVAPSNGTYYARFIGAGIPRTFNLVITRDATFDAGGNQSSDTAQPIDGTMGVLGALASTPQFTGSTVVPDYLANTEGNWNNGYPFNIGNLGVQTQRYQQSYAHTEFAGAGAITAIRFRRDQSAQPFTGAVMNLQINLGYSALPFDRLSSFFASNVGADTTTVYSGSLTLSSTGFGSPNPFDIVIPLSTPFYYDPSKGDLLMDVTMLSPARTAQFDSTLNQGPIDSERVYSYSATALSGNVDSGVLVTRFDMGIAPTNSSGDWYSVNVADTAHALNLTTFTPAGGPGEFNNKLDPHIELYDPSGNLVAAGVALADGRNESLTYVPQTTGTYRVRVTGANGTAGEYFLATNFSPVVTGLSGPAAVNENDVYALTGTFSDPDIRDTHSVVITWGGGTPGQPSEGSTTLADSDLTYLGNGVWQFTASHQYLDDNPTGTPSDVYNIGVTVTDSHGASGIGSSSVIVNNVPPVVQSLSGPASINENDVYTLTGMYYDPGTLDTHTIVINWGGGTPGQPAEGTTTLTTGGPNPAGTTLTYLGNGVWQFTASHQYLDDNPTGTPSDVYNIGVTVTDDDTGVGTGSTSVIVNNVAPVAGPITGPTPSPGVPGQTLAFGDTFTDVGTLDTHVATFDWGDGSSSPGAVTESHGSGSVNATHVYSAPGTYTITLTLTDDDTGTTSVTRTVTILPVALQNDPLYPGQTDLAVGGTLGSDTIVFTPGSTTGAIQVILNGVSMGVYNPTGRLIAFGQAGDDDIQVAGSITLPAWLYGGDGNDRLNAGAGNSVLIGGAGDDTLIGGSGRSLMIGGAGSDTLIGAPGDNIMIGGTTAFDDNDTALAAIMAEWTSDHDYATRIANLSGTGTTGLNGGYYLIADATVFDDGAEDTLTGGSGLDWFFVYLASGVVDNLTGQQNGEVITQL